MSKKPQLVLYHYCALRQIGNVMSYIHGVAEWPEIGSPDEYQRLRSHLEEFCGCGSGELVIQTLTPLNTPRLGAIG